MGDSTNIGYAHRTWSPWLGCEPVSPGCGHCYASELSQRFGRGAYRHGMIRTLTKDWDKPKRWNELESRKENLRDAVGQAPPPQDRVLVSMCDPFDETVPIEWKDKFLNLIDETPSLTWLLTTKRPLEAQRIIQIERDNIWLGVSVEDQERADQRIPVLRTIPAGLHWISYEPALGPINFRPYFAHSIRCEKLPGPGMNGGQPCRCNIPRWIVVGGESGFNHRRFEISWLLSTLADCRLSGVKLYVKQDSARFSGQQGRIPDDIWRLKQFPVS